VSIGSRRRLGVVVCGAGPAKDVSRLIDAALTRGWAVSVIATPSGLGFLDAAAIEAATGSPVRVDYRAPGTPRNLDQPGIEAFIIAPATFNTINKLAIGVSDTYALGALAEAVGRIPVTIVPFVNTALADRAPFRRSVDLLRNEGVRILFGEDDGWAPHPLGTGGERASDFPWLKALNLTEAALSNEGEA
jgi:phosphopantothenoylcysteine synthetase/decarboxylase